MLNLGTQLGHFGSICDLHIAPSALDTFEMSFSDDSPLGNEVGYSFVALINGKPSIDMSPGSTAQLFPPSGNSDISIIQIPSDSTIIDNHVSIDMAIGAILRWDRSTSTSVTGYNVYLASGGGSIVYSDDNIAAHINTTSCELGRHIPCSSGSGDCMVTISGGYRGDQCNSLWSVEIESFERTVVSSGGKLSLSIDGEAIFSGRDFRLGASLMLYEGVKILFEDDGGTPVVGDTWEFSVGIDNSCSVMGLPVGVNKFAVKAVSEAGIESSASDEIDVVVEDYVQPVSGVAIDYSDTENIVLSWTDPDDEDLSAINIYSNYEIYDAELLDYVYELYPIAQISPGVETFTLAIGTELNIDTGESQSRNLGVVNFYIRPVHANGNETPDSTMYSVNAIGVSDSQNVSAPFNLAVVQNSDGTVSLSFDIFIGDGVPNGFNVYSFNFDPDDDDYWNSDHCTYSEYTEGDSYPSDSVQVELGPFLAGETWYFGVRPVVDSVENINTDTVSIQITMDAPVAPDAITGGS